jgi:hypothetical protein
MDRKPIHPRLLAATAGVVLAAASCQARVAPPDPQSPPAGRPTTTTAMPTTTTVMPTTTTVMPTTTTVMPTTTTVMPTTTTVMPTTTTVPPTTTTVPAPTVEWWTYDLPAGTLTVSVSETGLEFWAMEPAPGWEYYTKRNTATFVDVLFADAAHDAEMKVRWSAGTTTASFDLDGVVTTPSPVTSTVSPARTASSG